MWDSLLNTKTEVNNHSKKLKDVFQGVRSKRCWIVIGYSGKNDPVFKRLAEMDVFYHPLFWIAHNKKEPDPHVLEKILPEGKGGYYIKNYNADKFFRDLAKELNLEPQIISKPFSHLKETTSVLTVYPISKTVMIDSAIKWFGEAKGVEHTEDALKREIKNDELIRKVRDIRVQNRFGQINEVFDEVMSSGIAEAKDNLAVALYNGGTDSVDLAEVKEDDKTVELLKEACENYARALKLKPDYLEALNNWGTALSKLAARTAGQEAEELFAQSFEKYERALKLKPDYPEALINWGTALSKLAKRKEGKKAEELFAQSFEKYMKAEKFKEGTAAYDIACNYALRGEVNKALNWLEKGLKMELLPSRRHVITDRDLDKIKGREAFKRILSKYRPE